MYGRFENLHQVACSTEKQNLITFYKQNLIEPFRDENHIYRQFARGPLYKYNRPHNIEVEEVDLISNEGGLYFQWVDEDRMDELIRRIKFV